MQRSASLIKDVLDSLIEKYGKEAYRQSDPVQLLHYYDDERDVEVAGFIAAAFAFGRAQTIVQTVKGLLDQMGPSPYAFVRSFRAAREGKKFKGFAYRFIKDRDLLLFLNSMRCIIEESGNIKDFFSLGYVRGGRIRHALESFVRRLFEKARGKGYLAGGELTPGLRFLLPDPGRGSACKRLNLYLRWMVRDDEIDVGLWKHVATSNLVVPLDTHLARVSRWIGLTKLRNPGWLMAESVTHALKAFDSEDPVKYDFALTRPGIVDGCKGGSPACRRCELREICAACKRHVEGGVTSLDLCGLGYKAGPRPRAL